MTRSRRLILAAVIVAACTACGSSSVAPGCTPSRTPPRGQKTLVIEGDPWSGYAPFRIPTLLDGTGYVLSYVEQLCQDVRADDLSSGRADIELTTLDQFVLHRPAGRVVGVIDQSQGADALALNSQQHAYLTSIDALPRLVREYDIDGRKPVLAYTGSSPSEMLLNELVNTTEELRLDDYELVSVDQSATALQMLRENKAQLAIIWAPDTSAAQTAGYTLAKSSKDVPDSIIDVIVASDRLAQRDPAAVQAVLRGFYRAVDGYLANPAQLEALIARDGNIQPAAAKTVIAGVKLYGTTDANSFMNARVFPLDEPQVRQSLEAIGSVLALSHEGVSLDGLVVDGKPLAAVAG